MSSVPLSRQDNVTSYSLAVPEYLIHGTIKDETRYRHYSSFFVIALSKNRLQLTLNRKMELIPGEKVKIKIYGLLLSSEVAQYEQGATKLDLLIEFVGRLRWQISNTLLQHTYATPKKLVDLGLSCKKIKSYLDYSFATTEDEYREVLMLRRKTYSAVNKMEYDRPLEQLKYFFDNYSDILIVRHRSNIIGSATIIYGNGKDKPFEVQQQLMNEGGASLEYNDSMIEVAALCVLKDYRKTDVMHGIFENLCYEMMKHKKDYIIASSDVFLAKTYKMIGFRDTGKTFIQPKYKDLHMHVLIVNKNAALKAIHIDFFRWWPIWGPIVKYMKKESIVTIGGWGSAKLYAREFAYKLMKALFF